ncbi:MAG: hypothetical protein JXA77_01230 [Bacteroidales bacterium]|nr:hypothetical protein [Bacteroidales bacterium]
MRQQIRKLPALLLTLLTFFCLSGKSQDIDYFAIFDHLDPGKVPTGILYDKVYPTSNVHQFDGSSITNTMTEDQWNLIYSELLMAHFDYSTIPELREFQEIINDFEKQNKVPVCIMNVEYNRIKDNALDDNLLEFLNNQLYEVPDPSESPYQAKRYFSAFISQLNAGDSNESDQVTFILDTSLYISNTTDIIQKIDIDFGRGKKYRNLRFGSEINVKYSDIGSEAIVTLHRKIGEDLSCKCGIVKIENSGSELLESVTMALEESSGSPIYVSIPQKGTYDGKEFKATFGFCFSCETTSISDVKKPIIILEGWDPTNFRGFQEIYDEINKDNFIPKLQNQGYDVILMNYDDGGAAIQGNAMVLRNFIIDYLQPLLENNDSYNEIVIMGVSMGGLVARYTLAKMESDGNPHNTKLFISMDSPQQGAYIPYAIQEIGYHGLNAVLLWDKLTDSHVMDDKVINDLYKRFSCTSSQQMLVYYRPHNLIPNVPAPSPMRTELLEEFDDFGNNGYPSKVEKMVAFSFGSGKGKNQGFEAGGLRYSYFGGLGVFDDIEIVQRAIPDFFPANIIKITLEIRPPNPCDFLPPFLKFLCWTPLTLRITTIDLTVMGTKPYENAPGSFQEFTKLLVTELDKNLGTDIGSDRVAFDCFIPTVSALHLIDKPLDYNIKDNLYPSSFDPNYYEVNNPSVTPYNAIYVEEDNKMHDRIGVSTGMINRAKELIAPQNIELKNRTIDNLKVQYEAGTSITLENVTLQNNSLLYLRAGQIISFGNNISIGKNCNFEVEAREFIECHE